MIFIKCEDCYISATSVECIELRKYCDAYWIDVWTNRGEQYLFKSFATAQEAKKAIDLLCKSLGNIL